MVQVLVECGDRSIIMLYCSTIELNYKENITV